MKRQPRQNQATNDLIVQLEQDNSLLDYFDFDDAIYLELLGSLEKYRKYDLAISIVDGAIDKYINRPEFYIIKAKLLLFTNDFMNALNCIEAAEKLLNGGNLEIDLIRVQILSLKGDVDTALSLVNQLASQVTKEELSIVYLTESYIYENMSDNEAMYNVLYKAAVLDPLNEDILNKLWNSIQSSRFYYKGIKLYKRLIDIQPFNHLAWYNLGNAYIYVGEYKKAIDALEYSFLINKEFEEGYMEFAEICVQEKQYKKALDAYMDVLDIVGEDTDVMTHIGNCYYLLGEHAKANEYFNEALILDGYNDFIYCSKAKNFLAANAPEKSIKALKHAIEIDDEVEEYYYFLAKAYRANNEITNALINYKKATKICPEQSFFWKKYVAYLLDLKLYSKAISTIELASESTYDVELDYYNAIAHMLKNSRKDGMILLENALKENFYKHTLIFDLDVSLREDKDVLALINYYFRELNPILK